ncbi:hypothetical protein GCM10023155_20160 [Bremerella cremea]
MGTVHLTCGQCGTPLLIQYQGQSIFTQRQDASEDSAANVQQQLHDLRTEVEIARLDAAWQAKRESLKVSYGRYGRGVPRQEFAVIPMVIFVIVAGLLFAKGNITFAVIVGLLGLLSMFVTTIAASNYQNERAKYEAKRQGLGGKDPLAKHRNDPRNGHYF